jgi:hypothetical protein
MPGNPQIRDSPICHVCGMDGITLESCHSTWIIDPDRMRFRRILKDVSVEGHAVTTNWRPYYHFQFDPQGETFTVSLNPDGSRRIQSWRHNEDCVQCAGHVTAELSLADLRRAAAI